MDTFKKIKFILPFIVIAILYGFFGTPTGQHLFWGDINLIDEGQFAAWANHMLNGKHMYQDIYITYGPLLVYPLYILFKVFGPSFFLVRFYLIFSGLIGVWSIYIISGSLLRYKILQWWITLLAILLPIISLRQGLGLISLYLLYKARKFESFKYYFFSGISLMFTFLVSQEIGIVVFIIFFITSIYDFINAVSLKKTCLNVVSVFLGIITVLIPFSVWALYEGWLVDYLVAIPDVFSVLSGMDAANGKNFPNALLLLSQPNIFLFIKNILSADMLLYWNIFFYITTCLFLFVQFISRKKMHTLMIFVSLYGLVLLPILLSRNGISHLFYVLAPTMIIMTYYIELIILGLHLDRNKIEKNAAKLSVLLLLLFQIRFLMIYKYPIIDSFNFNIGQQSIPRIGPLMLSKLQQEKFTELQNFVSKNTTSFEPIFFLTDDAGEYLIINRENSTRYDLPFLANTQRKRYEIVEDLSKHTPKYIFYDKSTWAVDGIKNDQRLPEVLDFIKKNYVIDQKLDTILIYRYKSSRML